LRRVDGRVWWRIDRRIELRIHQHDRLAVRERIEADLRSELDRARELHEDVDLFDAAREAWQFVVKNYPDSDGGRLAKQRLDQLPRR